MARGQTAWLVFWEGVGDNVVPTDRVVAILRPRTAERVVAQVVEALYASHAYSLAEMARWSKRPKSNPYRAMAGPGFLQCGHNPFLTAWYVRKLTVDVDEASGVETIRWEYPAQYRYNDTMSRTELIREPQAGEFRRPAAGPSQLGR